MDWFLVTLMVDLLLFIIVPHLLGIPLLIHAILLVCLLVFIPGESQWFRSLAIWDTVRTDYLGMSVRGPGSELLVKPDSSKQYIFAIHKHGVFSVTNIAYFALNKDMLHVRSVGTSVLFVLPIIKEFVGLGGAIPANKDDIIDVLNSGKSVAMSPGGIREVPGMTPGCPIIQREGFLKIAVQQNVPVVPIYAHGEEMLYDCHVLFPKWASKMLHQMWYPIGCIIVWGHPWIPFWPRRGKLTLYVGEPIKDIDEVGKMKDTFYSSLDSLIELTK